MLETGKLKDEARRRIGLSDFGDEPFEEALERLVDAINRESRLTDFGQKAIQEMLVGYLANRLEVEGWYAQYPEIENEQIVAPVFGVGLARSGSTALGHMLSRDPATRMLQDWEAKRPCLQVEPGADADAARGAFSHFDTRRLGVHDLLPRGANAPAECTFLLAMSGTPHFAFEVFVQVPSYGEWLVSSGYDMGPTYRYHRRVIKLLQWRQGPKRWFLRTPMHTYALEALADAYPDARFVMTHRDPGKAVMSVCSFMHKIRAVYVENPEPRSFGPRQEQHWVNALQKALAFRDRIGEERFFDLSHRRQCDDPLAQVRPLYQWLGWEFDASLDASIRQWQETHPKHPHGVSPDYFGLDMAEMAGTFKFYSDRFAHYL